MKMMPKIIVTKINNLPVGIKKIFIIYCLFFVAVSAVMLFNYSQVNAATTVCSSSVCYRVECKRDSDCGVNGPLRSPVCNGKSIYRYFVTYRCVNPNTSRASCVRLETYEYLQTCGYNQLCSSGKCVDIGCSKRASRQCIGNSVYYLNSCGVIESLYKNCSLTNQVCQSGQCISVKPTVTKTQYTNRQVQSVQVTQAAVSRPYIQKDRLKCYNDNVYWYDSLGNRLDLVKNCKDAKLVCKDGECVKGEIENQEQNQSESAITDGSGQQTEQPKQETVVSPEQNAPAAVEISQPAGIFQRWYFWVIAGLILVFLFIIIFRRLSKEV